MRITFPMSCSRAPIDISSGEANSFLVAIILANIALERECSQSPIMLFCIISKTDTPKRSPFTAFSPSITIAWLTEDILPGKPYTGEFTIFSILAVRVGSEATKSVIFLSDTEGSSISPRIFLKIGGIVGRLSIFSTLARTS